ncbi:MAG: helicase HerA-like domain-containing protein [Pseudobdellovibrio sp.]
MENKKSQPENSVTQLIELIISGMAQSLKIIVGFLLTILKNKNFKSLKFLFDLDLFVQFGLIKRSDNRITVADLKSKKKAKANLEDRIKISNETPLGISLTSGEVVFLKQNEINQHVLVAGATGEGKTTLMTTMIRHAMIHNRPIIIIDPKGDMNDVEKIRQLSEISGRGDKFKLFTLSFPESSISYNILKVGTPEQLKSKLVEALDLEHEFYGAIAAQYLGLLFDILDFLDLRKDLNLSILYKFLTSPNELGKIENRIRELARSEETIDVISKMQSLKSIERKHLEGLIAQISSLCLNEFKGIISGNRKNEAGLDIISALNNKEIIYFQLSLGAYGDVGKRFGKLVIQDLKLVTSLIQAGRVTKEFDFGVCFIDEAGSFLCKSFAELLKTIRSIGIGLNIFFQSIADLRTISPEFAEQIMGNTKVKIILRQDNTTDVETWSAMAGTIDSVIMSHQTNESGIVESKTGMGNMHEGKKMKVDFDVFKSLPVGQAVVINKGRHTCDLISIWQQDVTKINSMRPIILEKPNLFGEIKPGTSSKYKIYFDQSYL